MGHFSKPASVGTGISYVACTLRLLVDSGPRAADEFLEALAGTVRHLRPSDKSSPLEKAAYTDSQEMSPELSKDQRL